MDSGKHEKANVKKIIRNDLFRKGNKLRLGIKKRQTCRGRGGGGSIPERGPHSRSLEDLCRTGR